MKLGKLIYLYDDNHVTLSAGTDLTFTEDRARRFEAYGWHIQSVADGNDLAAIDRALRAARGETERPSLILVRTHIGYGSPHKQDSFESHGSPLGVDEVRLTKQNLGWPTEPPFYIPEQAREHFREAIERGKLAETEWRDKFSAYARAFPDLAKAFQQVMRGELPDGWDRDIPVFPADAKGLATRVAAGKVMNAVASRLPALIGGSADLNPSTHTALSGLGDFEPGGMNACDKQGAVDGVWGYAGRNLYFGVREHGMGAILNGLAAHGGALPFGATFLIFSDYMRPPIRLAALMGLHVIYVFTHDSIALGQDGPTHQPVEQLAGLRAVPGLTVIRPGDANETAVAWRVALEATGPSSCIGSDAAECAHARSHPICRGGRFAPRCICLGRCAERQAGRHSDSERFGGRPDHGGSTKAARSKGPGARRLHAELGIVRRSAAELSRPGVIAVNPCATCRRSGCIAGLASLRRRPR